VDGRVRLLLDVFDQAYTAPAWHGTPLKGTIRGVSAREALWRPAGKRHCIWDLVLHTAYWKCMVRRRLLRDPEIAFPRDGANWPALPEHPNAPAWQRDRAWHSKWPVKAEIYGIASHDLYHAGQVQILKRLMRS